LKTALKEGDYDCACEFFIGSADRMFRNLSKRIEVITPVFAEGPRKKLWEMLDICCGTNGRPGRW